MRPFTTFTKTLEERFSGVLKPGKHNPDDQACLLEAAHIAVGGAWSDTPDLWPDFRPLNDALWSSDRARTRALVPLLKAYWEWDEWGRDTQLRVMNRVIIRLVHDIIAELPGLTETVRTKCRTAATLRAAADAAWAAGAAARAVATSRHTDRVLQHACAIFIEAADAERRGQS